MWKFTVIPDFQSAKHTFNYENILFREEEEESYAKFLFVQHESHVYTFYLK